MSLKVLNDQVAVAGLVFAHNEKKETTSRFDTTDRLMNTLVSTKVVFNSNKFKAGDTVYFRADVGSLPQSRIKFTHEGQEFLLFPESMVVAVES